MGRFKYFHQNKNNKELKCVWHYHLVTMYTFDILALFLSHLKCNLSETNNDDKELAMLRLLLTRELVFSRWVLVFGVSTELSLVDTQLTSFAVYRHSNDEVSHHFVC